MRVEPSELDEVISVTSAMRPSWRSSGVATRRRHRLGARAGQRAPDTEIVGKSTCGSGETGSSEERDDAGQRDAERQQRRRDRPRDERRGEVHAPRSLAGVSGAARRRRAAQRARQAVEAEVDHRRREQRQHLADDQAADDREAERMAQLGARRRVPSISGSAPSSAAIVVIRIGRKRSSAGLVDRLARRLALARARRRARSRSS